MATQYTLTVKNNSERSGSVCVYQRNPDQEIHKNLYSLAWFSKYCHPNTSIKFRWTVDYSFVWCETGILKPGVFFDASEVIPADPAGTNNSTGFSKQDGAYLFTPTAHTATPGALAIATDGTIPNNAVSIGIGMSGQSAFACSATPNFTFTFQPHPEYWVAFGDFEEGEVIDLNTVSQTYQVAFPVNIFSKTLTLNSDNTWSEFSLRTLNSLR